MNELSRLKRRHWSKWVIFVVLIMNCGCSAAAPHSVQEKPPTDLRRYVQEFANDEGPIGNDAWNKLNSQPKQQLIDTLLGIRRETPPEDPLFIDASFVLCNLDYEYEANKDVIVLAFRRTGKEALGEERMIDRLIRRGDVKLLSVLFSAVKYSDGALSEGLSDTFATQLREHPVEFLRQLSIQPASERLQVYEIMGAALSSNDLCKVDEALRSYPKSSEIKSVAQEMLAALKH